VQAWALNICANTLKGRKVPTDVLYDFSEADVVPSGVAELGHLQAQDYAYSSHNKRIRAAIRARKAPSG